MSGFRRRLNSGPSRRRRFVLERTEGTPSRWFLGGSRDDGCALARECAKTKILRIPSRRAQRALVRVAPAVRKLDLRECSGVYRCTSWKRTWRERLRRKRTVCARWWWTERRGGRGSARKGRDEIDGRKGKAARENGRKGRKKEDKEEGERKRGGTEAKPRWTTAINATPARENCLEYTRNILSTRVFLQAASSFGSRGRWLRNGHGPKEEKRAFDHEEQPRFYGCVRRDRVQRQRPPWIIRLHEWRFKPFPLGNSESSLRDTYWSIIEN